MWGEDIDFTDRLPIVNVVADFDTKTPIDLTRMTVTHWNIEYNTKKAAKAYWRFLEPRCTAQITSLGKVTITGTKSSKSARQGMERVLRTFLKAGLIDKEAAKHARRTFKVSNLVAQCRVGFDVNLMQFYRENRSDEMVSRKGGRAEVEAGASYEPESFPSVFYRLPECTVQIFANGKLSFTGLRYDLHRYTVYDSLLPKLECCRVKRPVKKCM